MWIKDLHISRRRRVGEVGRAKCIKYILKYYDKKEPFLGSRMILQGGPFK